MIDMVRDAMLKHVKDSKGFLLDGFPRELEQAIELEYSVCNVLSVIYLDVSDINMVQRSNLHFVLFQMTILFEK